MLSIKILEPIIWKDYQTFHGIAGALWEEITKYYCAWHLDYQEPCITDPCRCRHIKCVKKISSHPSDGLPFHSGSHFIPLTLRLNWTLENRTIFYGRHPSGARFTTQHLLGVAASSAGEPADTPEPSSSIPARRYSNVPKGNVTSIDRCVYGPQKHEYTENN